MIIFSRPNIALLKNNYRYSKALFYLLLFSTFLAQAKTHHPVPTKHIVYAGTERESYSIKLLKHVLSYDEKTHYQLSAFGKYLPKMREFDLLGKHNGIDVVIGGATIEREQLALPIRFPILQGLYGWRIALVHKENKNILRDINNLSDFKKLRALQFHTWSDSETLRLNNIKLVKGTDIKGLYLMLDNKRADYFLRSVLEIDGDLARHRHLAIEKEASTLVWYPKAVYFYVGNNQPSLAKSIKTGLELALKDGSFKKLFMSYYGEIISTLQKEHRQVFKLTNPLLSPLTPLDRPELWLDLSPANKVNN